MTRTRAIRWLPVLVAVCVLAAIPFAVPEQRQSLAQKDLPVAADEGGSALGRVPWSSQGRRREQPGKLKQVEKPERTLAKPDAVGRAKDRPVLAAADDKTLPSQPKPSPTQAPVPEPTATQAPTPTSKPTAEPRPEPEPTVTPTPTQAPTPDPDCLVEVLELCVEVPLLTGTPTPAD